MSSPVTAHTALTCVYRGGTPAVDRFQQGSDLRVCHLRQSIVSWRLAAFVADVKSGGYDPR